ncbi:MAG: hypothetical protein K9J06_03240 [Flavobacteriales bacterium]|nr:hypothetical protein [Flavobacteriales bacterium]
MENRTDRRELTAFAVKWGIVSMPNGRWTPRSGLTIFYWLFSIFLLTTTGCGVYSFTGASISPDVKSVSIAAFPSYAPLAPPNMPQLFTEQLRDKFVNQTNLNLLPANGDIRFEGRISDYRTQPVSIQGNAAAQNRLSISVTVTYTDTKNEDNSFEKTFTRFADFNSGVNLSDVEQTLIAEINEQLIQDIFNQAVVNW